MYNFKIFKIFLGFNMEMQGENEHRKLLKVTLMKDFVWIVEDKVAGRGRFELPEV